MIKESSRAADTEIPMFIVFWYKKSYEEIPESVMKDVK